MNDTRLNPNDVESSILKTLISENNALRNDVNLLYRSNSELRYRISQLEERLSDDEKDIENLMK